MNSHGPPNIAQLAQMVKALNGGEGQIGPSGPAHNNYDEKQAGEDLKALKDSIKKAQDATEAEDLEKYRKDAISHAYKLLTHFNAIQQDLIANQQDYADRKALASSVANNPTYKEMNAFREELRSVLDTPDIDARFEALVKIIDEKGDITSQFFEKAKSLIKCAKKDAELPGHSYAGDRLSTHVTEEGRLIFSVPRTEGLFRSGRAALQEKLTEIAKDLQQEMTKRGRPIVFTVGHNFSLEYQTAQGQGEFKTKELLPEDYSIYLTLVEKHMGNKGLGGLEDRDKSNLRCALVEARYKYQKHYRSYADQGAKPTTAIARPVQNASTVFHHRSQQAQSRVNQSILPHAEPSSFQQEGPKPSGP